MGFSIKFDEDYLQTLSEKENSGVFLENCNYHVGLHPAQLGKFKTAITDELSRKIAKYDRSFNGILLGFKNAKSASKLGRIGMDNLWIHIDVNADCFVFRPLVGMVLKGLVTRVTRDHVGCLVYNTFNVSLTNTESEEVWEGAKAREGDEVCFEIIFVDLETRMLYIRGKLLSLTKKSQIVQPTLKSNKINFKSPKVNDILDDSTTLINTDVSIGDDSQTEPKKRKKKKVADAESDDNNPPKKKNKQSLDKIPVKEEMVTTDDESARKKQKQDKTKNSISEDETELSAQPKSKKKKRELSDENNETEDLNDNKTEKKKNKQLLVSPNDSVRIKKELVTTDEDLESDGKRKKIKIKKELVEIEKTRPENRDTVKETIEEVIQKSIREVREKEATVDDILTRVRKSLSFGESAKSSAKRKRRHSVAGDILNSSKVIGDDLIPKSVKKIKVKREPGLVEDSLLRGA